ncbi:gamma-glutamyltransferase [Nodularia spumigena CS-584]|jgi:gamma-glutamyltranspeptidase / glutathione hydrolase|uniref:Glutathione hydrolase proenzyme n=2 Tax=Nodularia spumigena TaxID=70799 RepID=A0ABU5UUZ1_NODSP|nr:gamma-glutamyltransferase [Nodularia spumigena]EAW43093.1 Gamma-glutamyltranspeptidase [Nodularia spumigena CCY9414]MDB9384743.1 gamma-glutamyltransferase [Nodularia spumigena CS-584]MEA5525435.1 gamma-glutamyltransferase [Nodularia spumigena UHCC 0143]MEA5610118.1 gamma-glutamyltransferase [Nodularia spumigena UHCC 0060]
MPIFKVSRRIAISTKRFAIAIFSCSLIIFFSQTAVNTFTVPLRSQKGMVVSAHPLASDAGIKMLRQGGNAVDAAVATTFAISVVEPFSAGIGGGGFLLMHSGKTGEIKALDFRERAPLKATKDMYLDADGKVRPNASVTGYLAVATPGTVAGMYEVHRLYGKLPWAEVVKPAIALAQDGFILRRVLSPRYLTVNNTRLQTMLNNPGMREIFTRNGEFYQPGERLVQRDLARTLTDIARSPHSFYTGNIAWAIASDMAKNGGLITLEDLKAYKPIWRTPVCGNFRQAKICSMPPPSSGGVHLLQMLNMIGETDLRALGWHHPDAVHLMAEAMKIAYADRSEFLGDPDFIKVPVEQLISPDYAKKRRLEIDMSTAKPASQIKPVDLRSFPTPHSLLPTPILPKESTETSHLTVVDEEHNAVSLTFTINLGFGAGIATPGTGIVLNNEMDDFAAAPGVPNAFGLVGNEANALAQLANGIAPRKTPLSSMTPTIITENGRLRMAVGTPGGSTIITQVLQIILNVLEYQMDVGAAVSVPRIHHQWLPDQLRVERWGLDTLTLQELRRRGHKINESNSWGNANAIAVTAEGDLEAAADPRGQGFPRSF